MLKVLTWNVAGRTGRLADQIRTVLRQDADIVCLQEVRESTLPAWTEAFAATGLDQAVDSSGRSDRKLFNLTVSHWPVTELEPFSLPQPERAISARVRTAFGALEVHNVHVPPLRGDGSVKIQTLIATHEALAVPSSGHRLLCGDLNTSGREPGSADTEVTGRWAIAQNLLLRGLSEWDLHDIYRELHGFRGTEVSCSTPGHYRKRGSRLDHILASRSLHPIHCEYQHGWRQEGFSDHSAVEGIFEPEPA